MTEIERQYRGIINKVFPSALIKYCENFDDLTCGWEILPEPSDHILFKVTMGQETTISIHYFTMDIFAEKPVVTKKRIFYGKIIKPGNHEPDLNIVTTLLENYKYIG